MKRKMFAHEEVNEWSDFRTFVAFVTDDVHGAGNGYLR